jgi:glycosyltransferase involved in cell wall biosynthesis
MRILLFTQYYPPEITAGAMRTESFASGLVARGHEVGVVCEVPNHPQGVIDPGFRGRTVFRAEEGGAKVRRVWVYATPTKSAASRIANYASYALMAGAVGARGLRPDVVLASSPPLPVGAAAAAVARRFGVPWVLDVRDLWPDIAVVLGQLPEGPPLELARRLERGLYRSASRITAVTEPFKEHIEANGGEGKVSVIYNGTSSTYLDAALSEPDRSRLGLPEDRFVLTYAGNLGMAQGLEAAVEAAAAQDDRFQLLLVGEGPRRTALAGMAEQLPPGRVQFRDLVPPEEAARLMRASDALLVPLAKDPAFHAYVPSKLFDVCAIGRPVIVATGGESERLVSKHDAAVCVPPEDSSALAAAIASIREDAELRDRLSRQAVAFASEYLRERGVERLEEILEAAVGAGSSASGRT